MGGEARNPLTPQEGRRGWTSPPPREKTWCKSAGKLRGFKKFPDWQFSGGVSFQVDENSQERRRFSGAKCREEEFEFQGGGPDPPRGPSPVQNQRSHNTLPGWKERTQQCCLTKPARPGDPPAGC